MERIFFLGSSENYFYLTKIILCKIVAFLNSTFIHCRSKENKAYNIVAYLRHMMRMMTQ